MTKEYSKKGEVGGALPKLLTDLSSALTKQQASQKALERRLADVDRVKSRAARRADELTGLLLRGAPSPLERANVLFIEVCNRQ